MPQLDSNFSHIRTLKSIIESIKIPLLHFANLEIYFDLIEYQSSLKYAIGFMNMHSNYDSQFERDILCNVNRFIFTNVLISIHQVV